MAQVITSPAAGQDEDAGKNWYRAETLKRLLIELNVVLRDAPDSGAKKDLATAIKSLERARQLFIPKS